MNRNLLITGASTGVGQALAVLAAKAGWTVHATMRNTAKREALDAAARVEMQMRQLDVTDPESVTRYIAEVIAADGRLDAFVAERPPSRVRTSARAEDFTALKTQGDPDGLKQRDRVVREILGR